MAPKKIIFLISIVVIALGIVWTILLLQSKKKTPVLVPSSMKIWITEWTTAGYESLVEGFKNYAPEYKNTEILFEKKATDPIRYRILLLSTMAEGTGPDIFMVDAGADAVVAGKAEPIPSSVLDFSTFEKRYDDIFASLIVSSWAKDTYSEYLLWVPLGFETLGIFYHKNLLRSVPKTWNDLDLLYQNGIAPGIFPTNLGLGPRYTTNSDDLIGYFYVRDGITDIAGVSSSSRGSLEEYLTYKDNTIASSENTDNDIYAPIMTLEWQKEWMDEDSSTTLDKFIAGDISMILGYPSIVSELEKSDKRLGIKSKATNIFTEKIPLTSPTDDRINIAKYSYFALSKTTQNPIAGVKFLEYLMTTDAQTRFLQNNDAILSAQREFWPAQEWTKISQVLSRSTLDAFIPDLNENLSIFNYWLKAEFKSFLSDNLDRNNNIDINKISEWLSHTVFCSTDTYNWKATRADCEK